MVSNDQMPNNPQNIQGVCLWVRNACFLGTALKL